MKAVVFLSLASLTWCVVLAGDLDPDGKALPELVIKTVKEGKNCERRAKAGDKLRVHYVGRLGDGNGKKFDASRDRGPTFNFQLGAGQVSAETFREHQLSRFVHEIYEK